MKKFLYILIAILFGLSNSIFSQPDSSISAGFSIKADVLLPIVGLCIPVKTTIIPITFEGFINNNQSLQLTVYYIYCNTYNEDFKWQYGTFSKSKAFQVIPEYKYFLGKKKNNSGFYLGTYLKYSRLHKKSEIHGDFPPYYQYIDYLETSLAVGPILGFQKYFWKHLAFESLIGLGYHYFLETHIIEEIDIIRNPGKSNGIDFRLAMNIGYKF